jgi:hypothetical protein
MSNDKWNAAFHGQNPGELPQRDPYASFAQHGAPPEQPHPHAEVPPGPAPWATYQAPPRKSRAWVWVLVVLACLALCGFGVLALIGAGGKAVVDEVNRQSSDRQADIEITSCSGDRFGLVTIKYTVHNSSATAQSYFPGFNVQSKTGTVYGQTADIVNDLAPGKDYQGSAVASIGEGHKDLVCALTGS